MLAVEILTTPIFLGIPFVGTVDPFGGTGDCGGFEVRCKGW